MSGSQATRRWHVVDCGKVHYVACQLCVPEDEIRVDLTPSVPRSVTVDDVLTVFPSCLEHVVASLEAQHLLTTVALPGAKEPTMVRHRALCIYTGCSFLRLFSLRVVSIPCPASNFYDQCD